MEENIIEELNEPKDVIKEEPKEEVLETFNGFTPIVTEEIEHLDMEEAEEVKEEPSKIESIEDTEVKNEVEDFTKLDAANDIVENKEETVEDFTKLDVDTNIDESKPEEIEEAKEESIVEEKTEEPARAKTLLEQYGENLSKREYVCNPAIGRENEIKQMILCLLTPEKSAILVGKPGIGKTAIVEGLSYQIQNGNVPDALKDYNIYKLNTSSLLGIMPGTSEPKIQVLLSEIKESEKLILFIDEIHTLIGAGAEGGDSLDFANIFKPGLDRGSIKIIGATTSDEYDRYILTDKAFVRRFQKIDVAEPTKEHTVKILMGSLPKIEKKTGAKLKYTEFVQEKIMTFIVDLTSEYRRVYELSARYPDVALTILQQAFSYAVFDNKKEVSIRDVRKAIANTKLVYPDVIKKELIRFNEVFSDIYLMETPQLLKGETKVAE